MRPLRPQVAAATALALSGCSLTPTYVRPVAPVPRTWPAGPAAAAAAGLVEGPEVERAPAASGPAPSIHDLGYRDVFQDPRLQTIIAEAVTNNRDLRVAAANVAASRAVLRQQRAQAFPELDAGISDRLAGGSNAVGGAGTPAGAARAGSGSSVTGTLGVTAFEIDLFGRIRALTAAAQNRLFENQAVASGTRLTLIGDVATAWLTYGYDQTLFAIASVTATSAAHSVQLTRARLSGGIAPRTDLDQAQTILATARADLAQQTTAVAQDVDLLTLLVGAPVDPSLLPGSIEQAGATLVPFPAGLDSAVLLRRPDVTAAEYELRAADADIGAARAALFPRLSLTGLLGLASPGLGSLFSGGAFSYSATPAVSYPIFRAGAGRAAVDQTRAQADAAVARYEKAIQTGFREVADALARRGTIAAQTQAQADLVAATADNYRLSDARYRGGIETFLESLDAQRSSYTAQRSFAAIELAGATNLVVLYRTLGGDPSLDRIAPTNGAAPTPPPPMR